jgi:integrase
VAKKTKTTDRKSANGSGSVWYDSSRQVFKWSLTITYDGQGKRVGVGGRAETRQEAENALTKARADQLRGLLAAPTEMTLAEYAAMVVKHQKHLRSRSVKLFSLELAYALSVRVGKQTLGEMRVSDVRTPHLKTALATLMEMDMKGPRGKPLPGKRISSRTLSKVVMRLRQVFTEAVRDQLIYQSPAEALKAVKRISSDPLEPVGTALDFPQLARFQELGIALHTAGLCRMWTALFTIVSLGLRKGEAMGLKWADIDFKKGVVKIQRARTTDDGQVVETGTKTFSSRRELQLPPSLIKALEMHRENQHLERRRTGSAWQDTEAVFATLAGNWVHPSHLSDALEAVLSWSDPQTFERKRHVLKRADADRVEAVVMAGERLPHLRIHDLRHTYATLALRNGIPSEVVSKNLGHSKISITLDIYRHVLESEQRQYTVDLFSAPVPERAIQPRAVN